MVDTDVIKGAVELAVRAPSLHNSQPWRWVADGGVLELFADPTRIGHSTDSTGREVLISCGAVLDHLRVAMAAAGWEASVERLPNPNTATTWQHSSSVGWSSSPMPIGPARRRSGIAERIGCPSRRRRSGARSSPCFAKHSPPPSPTLTSSPTVRGPYWPTRPGSPRTYDATIRPITPNFSGGQRIPTYHRAAKGGGIASPRPATLGARSRLRRLRRLSRRRFQRGARPRRLR